MSLRDVRLVRRLGKNWLRLHQLIYVIGVLAVLPSVAGQIRHSEPAMYAGILATSSASGS